MTFGLIGWLKSRYQDLAFEVPLWYPSRDKTDGREWLVTNGMGGYSMGTVSGANRRRYHAVLVSSMPPPYDRHIILSRVEEVLVVDGEEYELSTNHWASGVVSPTGYKLIESFSTHPCPTWVFEIDGHYLVKQLAHPWGTDQVYLGYHWLPDPDKSVDDVRITCKFLVGFRDFHDEVKGSSDKKYSQLVTPNQSSIFLDEESHRLSITWSDGFYEPHKQWWWDYRWPTESIRGLPETEDLFLVGSVSANMKAEEELSIGCSFGEPVLKPDCSTAVRQMIERQRKLIEPANLDGSQRADLLLLACDQFLVLGEGDSGQATAVVEGYPWYNGGGRAAMIGLPGLTLATRRLDAAKQLLLTYSERIRNGIMPNHARDRSSWSPDGSGGSRADREKAAGDGMDYEGADITLWWGWALYHYWLVSRDQEFVKRQLNKMIECALLYLGGAISGVRIDSRDGLLFCGEEHKEFSWMDAKVEGIPITPRPGKCVELCALWYNYLSTIDFLCTTLALEPAELPQIKAAMEQCGASMQKFWNQDKSCLYDVIETGVKQSNKKDDSVRCNQLLAVSLPFRALNRDQEMAILLTVEEELLTPMGIRSLSPSDPSYQGVFGCGFAHPDQYHRDLCRHQGTSWTWLLGQYCDALLNVFGHQAETVSRVRLALQSLFDHLMEEDCLGSMSEMFDGNRPHLPRGCPVYSLSVAETMRWYRWVLKQ